MHITIVNLQTGQEKTYEGNINGKRIYVKVPLGGVRVFDATNGMPSKGGLMGLTKEERKWKVSTATLLEIWNADKRTFHKYLDFSERTKEMG